MILFTRATGSSMKDRRIDRCSPRIARSITLHACRWRRSAGGAGGGGDTGAVRRHGGWHRSSRSGPAGNRDPPAPADTPPGRAFRRDETPLIPRTARSGQSVRSRPGCQRPSPSGRFRGKTRSVDRRSPPRREKPRSRFPGTGSYPGARTVRTPRVNITGGRRLALSRRSNRPAWKHVAGTPGKRVACPCAPRAAFFPLKRICVNICRDIDKGDTIPGFDGTGHPRPGSSPSAGRIPAGPLAALPGETWQSRTLDLRVCGGRFRGE